MDSFDWAFRGVKPKKRGRSEYGVLLVYTVIRTQVVVYFLYSVVALRNTYANTAIPCGLAVGILADFDATGRSRSCR